MDLACYALVDGPPPVAAYVDLRARAGLSPRTLDQATAAVAGAWAAVHVVSAASGTTVGMGRVIGDGGWYFHIVDMAVLPEHQRRGIGDAILAELLLRIDRDAPPGAFVSLMADPPGVGLYARHGFVASAPAQVGMVRRTA